MAADTRDDFQAIFETSLQSILHNGVLKMSNKIHVTEYFDWLLQMIKSKGNQFSLCFPCLRKKKKSLEENFAAAPEEIMRNYGKDIKPTDFVPSFTNTPTKSAQTSVVGPTTSTSSAPRTFLQPPPTGVWKTRIANGE